MDRSRHNIINYMGWKKIQEKTLQFELFLNKDRFRILTVCARDIEFYHLHSCVLAILSPLSRPLGLVSLTTCPGPVLGVMLPAMCRGVGQTSHTMHPLSTQQ